ncbi:MAG: two-CW domain-containing protein [Thermodesulfobacteriota bacterium]
MITRVNCWEELRCSDKEACPAYPDFGRECFAVTGTACQGEKQGSFEEKISKCRHRCKFYQDMMFGGSENKTLWTDTQGVR